MAIVSSACLVVADGAECEVVAGVLGGRDAEAVVEGDDEGLYSSTRAGAQVSR